MIKIFRMNDCDYVAAEDFESAVQWYLKFTGLTRAEALDGTEGVVSSESMGKLKYFIDDDVELRAHGAAPGKVSRLEISFAEELQHLISVGQEFPCLFASTEY